MIGKCRAQARREVQDQTEGPLEPLCEAIIQPVYHFTQIRKRDPDNLLAWIKPIVDALTDCDILKDDHRVIWLPAEQRRAVVHDHLVLKIWWV